MKLNLDFALYRGKTRLRDWWKQVKAHFIEVQDAVNELDDAADELAQAILDEAAERERVDGVIIDNLTDEIKERSAAESGIKQDIDVIGYTKMDCFNFGVFNVSDGTVEHESLDQIGPTDGVVTGVLDIGHRIAFSPDTDCSGAVIPVNLHSAYGIAVAGIAIEYEFQAKHKYLAVITEKPRLGSEPGPHTNYYPINGAARVICDNGEYLDIKAEAETRKNADDDLQGQIDELRESAAGGIAGTLATEEMIREMMKNATPDVYVPDGITIGLATDEQIKEICNE